MRDRGHDHFEVAAEILTASQVVAEMVASTPAEATISAIFPKPSTSRSRVHQISGLSIVARSHSNRRRWVHNPE